MTFHKGFEGCFKIFPRKKKAGITVRSYTMDKTEHWIDF